MQNKVKIGLDRKKINMQVTLPQLIKLLRKNLLPIIFCTMVAAIIVFGISEFAIEKTYVSTVKLYVFTPSSSAGNANENINELNYAQKVVNTYIEMLETNSFFENVEKTAGVEAPLENFKKMVTFNTLNDTEVFEANVSASSPEQAKKIADAVSSLAPGAIAQFKEGASLKIVDPATYPDKPSSPHVLTNTVLGLLLGLVLSVCWFLLRDSLDLRIKGEEDITEDYNLPILASIPAFNKDFTKQKRNHSETKIKKQRG